jgi:hypothetical protein
VVACQARQAPFSIRLDSDRDNFESVDLHRKWTLSRKARARSIGTHAEWDSKVQEPIFNIDLEHDTASVFLTVVIPKSTDEVFVAEFLRMVSRAFAETEGVSTEWMHAVLEKQVRGFEDATHIKFVWERSFRGRSPFYPQRLGENLAKQRPSRTLN